MNSIFLSTVFLEACNCLYPVLQTEEILMEIKSLTGFISRLAHFLISPAVSLLHCVQYARILTCPIASHRQDLKKFIRIFGQIHRAII